MRQIPDKNLREFITYLRSIGKEKSASLYQYELRNFSKAFSLEGFTVPDVERFITDLNPYSANATVAALKKYCWFKAQHDNYTGWSRLRDGMSGLYKKPPRTIKKEALTLNEIERLLDEIGGAPADGKNKRGKGRTKKPNVNDHLLDCTILLFYFGWRPVELTVRLANGKIDGKNQTVKIKGAKTMDERISPYSNWVEPTLLRWAQFAKEKTKNNKRPELWIYDAIRTRHKSGEISMKFTPKMARKTFQTAMRLRNVDEWKIDYLMGHTGRIPGIYTDWTMMVEDMREVMDEGHYIREIVCSLSTTHE